MPYPDGDLSKPHPEIEEVFKKKGIPKLPLPTRETLQAFRKNYRRAVARYNEGPLATKFLPRQPTWTEFNKAINVRDATSIDIRIYVPKTVPSDGAPVAVVAHGGGWYMGDLDTEALLCQVLCHHLGLVVVNVAYRLYPDVEFPVPITDVYDAVKWTAANISTFSGNPRKGLLVGGNSGGSTFACIAVHLARDEELTPPITGCFLFCPILTDDQLDDDGNIHHRFPPERNSSHETHEDAPLMNRAMKESIRSFANLDPHWRSPLLTPFNFPNHSDIPPTYIQLCGMDPWRDSGRIYGEELERAGGVVKADVYAGLPHCWWTTYPMLKVCELWMGDVLKGMGWLLQDSDGNSKHARL